MKKLPKSLKIALIVMAVLVVGFIVLLEAAPEPEETTAPTEQTEATEAVPHRKEAIGVSDKDCADFLSGAEPSPMLDDVTGKWKLVRVATTEGDFTPYALSYAEKYLTGENSEIHWIVNFTTKTTTSVKLVSGIVSVDVFEYVDKEEHSGHKIGGGMPLGSYFIYTDNGDIEKI